MKITNYMTYMLEKLVLASPKIRYERKTDAADRAPASIKRLSAPLKPLASVASSAAPTVVSAEPIATVKRLTPRS